MVKHKKQLFNLKKIIWSVIGLGIIVSGFKSPMVLIYAMAIFVFVFHNQLLNLFPKLNPLVRFMLAGIIFGLFTEICAIWQNWDLADSEKILLSPNPMLDLLYGLFYYLFVLLAWLIPLSLWYFSKKSIFIMTALYGVLVEQSGAIALQVIRTPQIGIPIALIIGAVYGIFPTLAHYVANFELNRKKNAGILPHIYVAFFLFLQYAINGNFVLPTLKKLTNIQ